MDQQESEDVEEDSVYDLITALCISLLRNSTQFTETDAEATQKQVKSLRRIAFTRLLKRSSDPNFERNQCLTENYAVGLFILVAANKAANNDWTQDEFVKTCKLLDKWELFFRDAAELSSASFVGRMLIALGFHRAQQATTSSNPTPMHALWSLDEIANIPPRLQLDAPLSLTSLGNECFTRDKFLWTNWKSVLERFQIPIDTMDTTRERLAIELRDGSQGSPRSDSRIDEGFSSPSDFWVEEGTQPFDWSNVPDRLLNSDQDWECFSLPTESQSLPSVSRALRDQTHCPTEMFQVPHTELVECIRALLVGVPSHIFKEVDGEFITTLGLLTEKIPPHLLHVYCKQFRRGGMLFSKLLKFTKYYDCITSASMSTVIRKFISNYMAYVYSMPLSTTLMTLTLDIAPLINMLEYLVDLFEGDRLEGWRLLEKLYEDALQMVEPNFIHLSSNLFVDCYTAYLRFIEKWIFEGEWHRELFFQKNISTEDITDWTSWLQSYSFNPSVAPSCLPAAAIYKCGKMCHLVKNKTLLSETERLVIHCQPKMKMLKTKEDLAFMEQICRYYSNIGDALCSEVRQKCWKRYDLDLSSIAKVKAEDDYLKYKVEKATERERATTHKLENLMRMKEELVRFEKSRNTQELKQNLYDLLEEDRQTYHHLRKLISSTQNWYDLIEQFIINEERLTKKSLLNSWKERRYDLNVSRSQHFKGGFNITECSSPLAEQNIDAVDNAERNSTNETAPLASLLQYITSKRPGAHKPPATISPLVDLAPNMYLVLSALADKLSSSSDESSSDNLEKNHPPEILASEVVGVSPSPGTSFEGVRGSPLPGTSSEVIRGSSLPSTSSEGMRDSPIPGTSYAGMRGSPLPTSSAGMKGSPLPSTSSEAMRGSPLSGTSYAGMRGSPLPSTSSAGMKGSPLPSTSSEGMRSSPLPGTSYASMRSSPLPSTSSDGMRGSPLPGTSYAGMRGSPLPSTSSAGMKGSPIPSTSSEGMRSSPLPGTSYAGTRGSPLPSTSFAGMRGSTSLGTSSEGMRSSPPPETSSDPGPKLRLSQNPDTWAVPSTSKSDGDVAGNSALGSSNTVFSPFDISNDIYKNFFLLQPKSACRDDDSSQDSIELSGYSSSRSLLRILAIQSVELPLCAQYRTLKNRLNHKLLVENDLLGHLRRVRNVFLKHDGTGAQTMASMLCRNSTTFDPIQFSAFHNLRNIMRVAYPKDCNYLILEADTPPQAFDSTNPVVFDFLSLYYSCDWPLTIVLTDRTIHKYCTVWRFLNAIDITLFRVHEVFGFLQGNSMGLREDTYRQIQLHRHIMLSFVNALKFFCGLVVSDTWTEMAANLQTEVIDNPNELHGLHHRFLRNLRHKLMLSNNKKRVEECLMKILHYVLLYCSTLHHAPWTSRLNGHYPDQKLRQLLRTFSNFKQMVEHLKHLLDLFIYIHGNVHLQTLRQQIY